MHLANRLGVTPGVTAVMGGGGKTTLLQTLGALLAAEGPVLLCTTTKMLPIPGLPCARTADELETLRRSHRLLCAGTVLPDSGKLTAPAVPMETLAAQFRYVLVEADGAAHRPLKAHAPHEPVIPPEAGRVICVVGASGFGRPIGEAAHRPERYAQLAGVSVDAVATPQVVAAVLAAEGLHHMIYVNQVESAETRLAARELATIVKEPVVLGSLWKGEYEGC